LTLNKGGQVKPYKNRFYNSGLFQVAI